MTFSDPRVPIELCGCVRRAGSEWNNAVLKAGDDMNPWALKRAQGSLVAVRLAAKIRFSAHPD